MLRASLILFGIIFFSACSHTPSESEMRAKQKAIQDSINYANRQKTVSDSLNEDALLNNEEQTETMFEAREHKRYIDVIDTTLNGLNVIMGSGGKDTFMKAYYIKGLKNGECVWYFKNSGNKISARENYVNDTLNGLRITYHEDGGKEFVENYVNGKLEGKRLIYMKGGELLWAHEVYKNGELIPEKKTKAYTSDGQKCSQCFGHYRGGFCSQCGKAAPDRLKESYSKLANCEMCNGLGFVPRGGIHGGKKLCPSCKGKRKQIY